jgi:tetratricopeptide (TPR) repeat protein
MLSAGSPVRSALDERMNSFLRDSKTHTRTNSMTSPPQNQREGMTSQVHRMKLEADLHLEGGDVEEYIKVLDQICEKIKLDKRFKKLQYEIATEMQKYGHIEKSQTILAVLYEETSRYDDDTVSKNKKLFQFSLDIGNNYFSCGRFKRAFEFYGISLKNLQWFSSCDLSIAQLYSNKGLCCLYLGDYDVSEGYFRKVIKVLVERIQDFRKEKLLMVAYKNIGAIYELKQDSAKALSFYVKALKCGLKVYSPNSLEMADVHYQIWCALLDEGKEYDAMQRLEKVIYMMNKEHENLKSEGNFYLPRVGSYYVLLGQFYFKQNHFENSYKWLEAALTVWQDIGFDQSDLGYQTVLELFQCTKDILNKN